MTSSTDPSGGPVGGPDGPSGGGPAGARAGGPATRPAGRVSPGARGAAVLAAALALGACSGGGGTSAVDAFPVGDGAVTVLPPGQRPAPGPLRGPTVDGGTADLAAYRGHVVVLNVWGSWCPPCQAEARDLQAASQALAGKGVKFLGIAVKQQGVADAQAFQRTYGVTYPSLYDQGSDSLLALQGTVAPNAIPSTVVLDQQGRIAARLSGRATKTTVVDLVDDVIANRVRTS